MLHRVGWTFGLLTLAVLAAAWASLDRIASAAAAPTTLQLTTTGNTDLYSLGYCGPAAPEPDAMGCAPIQRAYTFTLPTPLTASAVVSATLHFPRVGLYIQVPGPNGEAHMGLPPSTCTTAMTAANFSLQINATLTQNLGGIPTAYAMPGGPGFSAQPPPYDIDITNVVHASLGGPPGASSFVLQLKLVSPCNQGTFLYDLPTVDLSIETDTTPPTLSCSASPSQLWPPNHQLVTVTATVTASDTGGSGLAGYRLVSVTSNEPDNGQGDGDTAGDIQGWTVGTSDTTGQLRAERSGGGSGRVYTLTYEARDTAGNTATATCTVAVPHDRGR